MLKTLYITELTPRNIESIKEGFSLTEGLWGLYIFGYFFLGGLILALLSFLFLMPGKFSSKIFPIVASVVVFGGFSYYLLNRANTNYQQRYNALTQGVLIEGKVIGKDRQFHPLKSSRDYTLQIQYQLPSGQSARTSIVSSKKSLHQTYQKGELIKGLMDVESQSVFFPAELGYQIQVRK